MKIQIPSTSRLILKKMESKSFVISELHMSYAFHVQVLSNIKWWFLSRIIFSAYNTIIVYNDVYTQIETWSWLLQ